MENKSTNFKEYPKLTRFLGILFAISAILLAVYIICSVTTKNSIRANLDPIVSDLLSDSGAESVTTNIYAEPDSMDMPWNLEFHVFLTANYADLRRLSETTALEILNNGVVLGETEYSYDWDVLDYALYNRTVTANGKTYPVFVTLSDGKMSYTIEEDSLYDENRLYEGNAYQILRPSSLHKVTTILILSTLVFFALFGWLVYRKIQHKIEVKCSIEKQKAEETRDTAGVGLNAVLKKIDNDISAEQTERKKEKKKKVVIFAGSTIAVLALAVVLIINLYVIPNNKYNDALALNNAGNIDEAYNIWKSLGNFKDSARLCDEIDYVRVDTYMLEGKIPEAYWLLCSIRDHEDSEELISVLENQYPALTIMHANVGDIIQLGEYEQDNNTSNGKEPIEWIVLHNEDGEVYLLSKYVLDAQQFNTANIKECSLDDWLKMTFSKNAFESVNIDIITRVGILQEIDIDNYNITKEQRMAEYTPYAMSQKPEYWSYDGGYLWWVIDDDLFNGGGDISAPVVLEDGRYGMYGCDVIERCGVRPAVWLFADPNNLPAEPVFDGSAPTQWRPSGNTGGSSGGGKRYSCSWCGGDGRTHDWNDEGTWCWKCHGDGWIDEDD